MTEEMDNFDKAVDKFFIGTIGFFDKVTYSIAKKNAIRRGDIDELEEELGECEHK